MEAEIDNAKPAFSDADSDSEDGGEAHPLPTRTVTGPAILVGSKPNSRQNSQVAKVENSNDIDEDDDDYDEEESDDETPISKRAATMDGNTMRHHRNRSMDEGSGSFAGTGGTNTSGADSHNNSIKNQRVKKQRVSSRCFVCQKKLQLKNEHDVNDTCQVCNMKNGTTVHGLKGQTSVCIRSVTFCGPCMANSVTRKALQEALHLIRDQANGQPVKSELGDFKVSEHNGSLKIYVCVKIGGCWNRIRRSHNLTAWRVKPQVRLQKREKEPSVEMKNNSSNSMSPTPGDGRSLTALVNAGVGTPTSSGWVGSTPPGPVPGGFPNMWNMAQHMNAGTGSPYPFMNPGAVPAQAGLPQVQSAPQSFIQPTAGGYPAAGAGNPYMRFPTPQSPMDPQLYQQQMAQLQSMHGLQHSMGQQQQQQQPAPGQPPQMSPQQQQFMQAQQQFMQQQQQQQRQMQMQMQMQMQQLQQRLHQTNMFAPATQSPMASGGFYHPGAGPSQGHPFGSSPSTTLPEPNNSH